MRKTLTVHPEFLLRSLILLGFSLLLLWLAFSGKIILYIHPRFTGLIKLTGALLFLMFLVQSAQSLQRQPYASQGRSAGWVKLGWKYLLFLLPLLMVCLLPNTALDAGLAQNKGLSLGEQAPGSKQPATPSPDQDRPAAQDTAESSDFPEPAPSQSDQISRVISELRQASLITVTDENFTLILSEMYQFPEAYAGKEITLLGFVLKEPDFPPGRFGLVRYIVTCCSADAVPGGLLCESGGAANYEEGAWVSVRGVLQVGRHEDQVVPVVKVTSLKKTQEPRNSYVYPVY